MKKKPSEIKRRNQQIKIKFLKDFNPKSRLKYVKHKKSGKIYKAYLIVDGFDGLILDHQIHQL